jgi:uncharacterized HAD superfamily protein/hypoxanthine phosphoribosyltransferase
MLGFVSYSDLSRMIRDNIHALPSGVDLVVGLPRSGMIPAYMIGLYLNRLVIDVERFLYDGEIGHGRTRPTATRLDRPSSARSILVVDDSLTTGGSMDEALRRIHASGFRGQITRCAAVISPSAHNRVDVYFTILPMPRLFEWNAFHHPLLDHACLDLDGILCFDPTTAENDDGLRYQEFLRTARPFIRPTRRIAHIVSARLEKYRQLTEEWLEANGVEYGQLHLIDLPSAKERKRLNAHYSHKARVYRETGAMLFFESEPMQAREIARLARKPVLCSQDMILYRPDAYHPQVAARNAVWHMRKRFGRIKGKLRSLMASSDSTGHCQIRHSDAASVREPENELCREGTSARCTSGRPT